MAFISYTEKPISALGLAGEASAGTIWVDFNFLMSQQAPVRWALNSWAAQANHGHPSVGWKFQNRRNRNGVRPSTNIPHSGRKFLKAAKNLQIHLWESGINSHYGRSSGKPKKFAAQMRCTMYSCMQFQIRFFSPLKMLFLWLELIAPEKNLPSKNGQTLVTVLPCLIIFALWNGPANISLRNGLRKKC